jgi:hypothetical protein
VIASLLFHLLNPHMANVSRYLTMTIGPLIGLACVAAWHLAARLPQRRSSRILIVSAILISAIAFRVSPRTIMPLGYRDAIGHLAARGELEGRRLMVVSDEMGEGAFVSEAAVLSLQPAPMMIRGSKLLASDTWGGHNVQLRYASAAALMDDLEAMHISYVLVDLSAEASKLPYFNQVAALVLTEPERFARVRAFPADAVNGPRRSLALYRVTSASAGEPKPIELHLKSTLGRNITR